MVVGVALALLWLVYLFVNLRLGARVTGKILGPEIAPVTQGWGMRPRYGDEYESVNVLGIVLAVIIALGGAVIIYFLLNMQLLSQVLAANKPLGLLVIGAICVVLVLGVVYIKGRLNNQQRLYERLPRGNCLVLYKKPLVIKQSYVFTVIFGPSAEITESKITAESKALDAEEELPRPAGGRLHGIFYNLSPKARGQLLVTTIAPAFRVTPESREFKIPIKEDNDKAKFVIIPTEVGKHSFIFELSVKGEPVGNFETTIQVNSRAADNAVKLVQIITPLATFITLALEVLKYLKP